MKEDISRMGQDRLYSVAEDEFIREHYTTTPHKEIAEELGRTVKSVRRRATKIGCERCKPHRRWTTEEDDFILASKGKPLSVVAEQLGRDKSDVWDRAKKLGWKSWRRPDGEPCVDAHGYEVHHWKDGKPVLTHRVVMEEVIGRRLKSSEIVHHIDLNKRNNNPKNLFLCKSPAEHARCHNSLNAIAGELGCDGQLAIRIGLVHFDLGSGIYV